MAHLHADRDDPVRKAIAALIALAALLNLASALSAPIPERVRLIGGVVPLVVPQVANVLVVQAGLLLLFLSRQLARGKRRAWQAAVGLLGVSAVLHVVKGLDVEEAGIAVVLIAGLVATRKRFRASSDAPSFYRLLRIIPALVVFCFGYGLSGVYLHSIRFRQPLPSVRDALVEVGARLIWLEGPLMFHGRGFSRWFPDSITAIGTLSILYVLYMAFRPVVFSRHLQHSDDDHAALRPLVATDPDSLSYFLLRDDKIVFFNDGRTAALGYGVVGGVALISGDPVGPMEQRAPLLERFTDFCHERGWRAAAIGIGAEMVQTWTDLDFKILYVGDEAVVDVSTFSLEGRSIRKVRQACSAVERAGYTIEWHASGALSPDLRRALRHVSETWRQGDVERGFTMTLGRLFDERDPDCLVAVVRDAAGYARGFLHFVPVGDGGYSLDVIRRDAETPSGLAEYMIARTLEHLRDVGAGPVSLNFAFLRQILRPDSKLRLRQRMQQWIALKIGPWFQIESLYRFNNKFGPTWVPRYAAYEDALAMPSVILAAVRAEKLVDWSILRRGQGGKRARQAQPE